MSGKFIFLAASIAGVVFVGCAEPFHWGPTAPRRSHPTSILSTDPRVQEIRFTGGRGSTYDSTHAGALRHAADVTLRHGFQAFVLIKDGGRLDREEFDCTLYIPPGGCTPATAERHTVLLTIQMLMHGEAEQKRRAGQAVYDATATLSQHTRP